MLWFGRVIPKYPPSREGQCQKKKMVLWFRISTLVVWKGHTQIPPLHCQKKNMMLWFSISML